MQQCSLSLRSAHSFTAVAFRDISSTALRKLLLAIEMHMTVCELQATHRSTIVAGLLRQSCFIKVSRLGGLWMAKQWLTPRGRWCILRELRELRENRGFRWLIGRYMPIEFGILKSPRICTRGQSATCRGVKYVSSGGISGDFRNPAALVQVFSSSRGNLKKLPSRGIFMSPSRGISVDFRNPTALVRV